MSSFAVVAKAFPDDAASVFRFLKDELGMSGPGWQSAVMPTVAYVRSGLRYSIRFDADDQSVDTRVEMEIPAARLVAELANLVAAANLGSRNQVPASARSLRNLRRTLESHAGFVRLLYPLLTGPGAEDLMRKADARTWHAH
jgi:hypothetical protein